MSFAMFRISTIFDAIFFLLKFNLLFSSENNIIGNRSRRFNLSFSGDNLSYIDVVSFSKKKSSGGLINQERNGREIIRFSVKIKISIAPYLHDVMR